MTPLRKFSKMMTCSRTSAIDHRSGASRNVHCCGVRFTTRSSRRTLLAQSSSRMSWRSRGSSGVTTVFGPGSIAYIGTSIRERLDFMSAAGNLQVQMLRRFAKKNRLSAQQRRLNRFEPALNLLKFFKDPRAVTVFERGAQKLALADQLLVLRGQRGKSRRFPPETLRYKVIFRHGQLRETVGKRADAFRETFKLLCPSDGRRVGKWFRARRCRKKFAAVIALRLPHAAAGNAKQPTGFRADELIVRAKLVFKPIEVIAPAVKKIGG